MPRHPQEAFSIVRGGPLYDLCCRCGLTKPPIGAVGRRLAILMGAAWLPLFLLSASAGTLAGGVELPFLLHIEVQARLLLALPLLLAGEVVVHHRLEGIVRQFTERGLVPAELRPAFDRAVDATRRRSESAAAEFILALIAIGGHWLWTRRVALPMNAWYGSFGEPEARLSAAGGWYVLVSMPVFRFFLYRWYYRVALWYAFLWRVSRLPLRLNALHPDRAAGLGFLAASAPAFGPVILAHGAWLSGMIGDYLWHAGQELPRFKGEIVVLSVFLVLGTLLPLSFFAPRLVEARRAALAEFGRLGARYVSDFRRRWLRPDGARRRRSPLGSPDVQSLADLGSSFGVVRETGIVPFGKRTLLLLTLLTLSPFAPLTLTMLSLEEILSRLGRFLL